MRASFLVLEGLSAERMRHELLTYGRLIERRRDYLQIRVEGRFTLRIRRTADGMGGGRDLRPAVVASS
jgi:hypothetical protein